MRKKGVFRGGEIGEKMVMKRILILVVSIFLGQLTVGAVSLLPETMYSWQVRTAKGAEGFVKKNSDGVYCVNKQNSKGVLFFLNGENIAITPGKSYKTSIQFRILSENATARLMLSMPGGTRRPYPVSKEYKYDTAIQQASFEFKARPDESNLRIHLVLKGEGAVEVTNVNLREVEPINIQAKLWGEDMLKRIWSPFKEIKSLNVPGGLEAIVRPNGGFQTDHINWDAAKVKAVEIKFRAFDEPGNVRLKWNAEVGKKYVSSSLSRSIPPDGEWHTLIFDVSKDRKWVGHIKHLQICWECIYNPCRIGLKQVKALSYLNVIPGAESLSPKNPIKISMLKPRGEYKLTWVNGHPPKLILDIYDVHKKIIKTVTMTEKEKHFKVPELAAYAVIRTTENAAGYPVLALEKLSSLNRPEPWWEAAWIWSRNGVGPSDNVWFKKTFHLSEIPKVAQVVTTGDDDIEYYINGMHFIGNNSWKKASKHDVVSALKKGENEIVSRVFNGAAWGALLFEMYIESKDGKHRKILSDKSWKCNEGGSVRPKSINAPVFVYGLPPVSPWGTLVGYQYVGPQVRAQVKPDGDNYFTIKPEALPPVKKHYVKLKVSSDSGRQKSIQVAITPATSKWLPGKDVKVKYKLPQGFSGDLSGEKFTLSLDCSFLKIIGSDIIGTVEKQAYENKPLPAVTIKGAGKRAWIEINGKRHAPIYFDYGRFSDAPEEKINFIENGLKGGTSIIRAELPMKDMWLAPDKYDFSKFDKTVNTICATAPNVYVMMVVSSYMPKWWLEKYPDEATAFFYSKPSKFDDFQSLASKKWLVDMRKSYFKLIEHIKKQPYASRFIGISPADGTTWEWMWSHGRGHNKRVYSGYSPAALKAYRQFLKNKYGNDATFAKAWNDRMESISKVMPPHPKKRLDKSSIINMLDPEKDRDLMDWFEFRNKTVSDDIIYLCKAIKDASDGKLLAGTYYGYLVMFSRMFFHLQDGGHLGINKVAKSTYVDYVISPTMYHWRKLGMADNPMQPVGAFTAHGKLIISEFDYRTYSEPTDYERRNGKVDTVEQTAAVLNQGLGLMLTQGTGGHYMELHERWFLEPVILKMIKEQIEFYNSLPEKPKGLTPVEVCIVSDEISPMYFKNNLSDGIHVPLISEVMRRIREAGFCYRHVLLSDVLQPGLLPGHKMYIMTNTMVLGEEQRKVLKMRFEKENASVLYLYAPGVYYPNSPPSAKGVADMLGMDVEMLKEKQSLSMDVIDEYGGIKVSCNTDTGPWFYVTGGYDAVIGKGVDNKILAAFRKKGGRNIWFSTIPNLPTKMLKIFAKQSGVRLYANTDDVFHIGNDFIFVHTKTAGEKSFNLPENLKAKAVIGPFKGTVESGEKWTAESGITYGFMLEE